MVREDHNLVSGAVTGTPPKPSTSLQLAKSRLETAIDRLDRALAQRAQARAPEAAPPTEPSPELEAARVEIKRLRETNATVGARLDAAIGKVKVLIDD
jgi:hypothetical protein